MSSTKPLPARRTASRTVGRSISWAAAAVVTVVAAIAVTVLGLSVDASAAEPISQQTSQTGEQAGQQSGYRSYADEIAARTYTWLRQVRSEERASSSEGYRPITALDRFKHLPKAYRAAVALSTLTPATNRDQHGGQHGTRLDADGLVGFWTGSKLTAVCLNLHTGHRTPGLCTQPHTGQQDGQEDGQQPVDLATAYKHLTRTLIWMDRHPTLDSWTTTSASLLRVLADRDFADTFTIAFTDTDTDGIADNNEVTLTTGQQTSHLDQQSSQQTSQPGTDQASTQASSQTGSQACGIVTLPNHNPGGSRYNSTMRSC